MPRQNVVGVFHHSNANLAQLIVLKATIIDYFVFMTGSKRAAPVSSF